MVLIVDQLRISDSRNNSEVVKQTVVAYLKAPDLREEYKTQFIEFKCREEPTWEPTTTKKWANGKSVDPTSYKAYVDDSAIAKLRAVNWIKVNSI